MQSISSPSNSRDYITDPGGLMMRLKVTSSAFPRPASDLLNQAPTLLVYQSVNYVMTNNLARLGIRNMKYLLTINNVSSSNFYKKYFFI